MQNPSVDRRPEPTRQSSDTPSMPRVLAAVLGVLGACDMLLLVTAVYGLMPLVYGVAAHAALIAVAAVGAVNRIAGNRAPWAIGLLATAVAGPLGALGALLIMVLERSAAQSPSLLGDWYAWMSGSKGKDRATATYEAILTGRSLMPGVQQVRRFCDVIANGALPEKQAILGLVGLKYHRDCLPVLQLALRSPQASVRAQAAAVFVKLKERFRGELAACIAARAKSTGSSSAARTLTDAQAVLGCCQSGFIDAAEAREALRAAAGWCATLSDIAQLSREGEELICELLAGAGDHQQLVNLMYGRRGKVEARVRELLARSLMILGQTNALHALLAGNGRVKIAG